METLHISARAPRPPSGADRWEGDLLRGSRNSASVTLVDPSSRYALLIRMPQARGFEQVLKALAGRMLTLPEQLCRSLSWDQGKEMAQHARFTIDTGLQIYFCDAQPWQRGTNENTNGLLRQYFPRRADLSTVTQRRLELNCRPPQTLGWLSPSEKFAEAVAMTV